jgi:two-component system sensor histidine kinase KdpD
VLACVGHGPGAARVVAAAARLAALAGAPWHAVLVETPRTRRMQEPARLAALEKLRQAASLGAVTSVLQGDDAATVIAAYARRHACATAVLARGRTAPGSWVQPTARRLARQAPGMDIVEVAALEDGPASSHDRGRAASTEPAAPPRRYLAALAASLLTALIALPLLPLLDVANVAMLFLLCVVLVAIRFGRGPAIAATLAVFCALVLAVPRRAYDVSEFKYAVALGVMLAVGWITARLTAGLREQAEAAIGREARTRALYEFARALSAALQLEQVFEITRRFVERSFDARGVILLPGADGRLAWPQAPGGDNPALNVLDMAAAQWAFEHAKPAGAGTATLPSNGFLYLPLLAPMRTRGVLAVRVAQPRTLLVPEQRELLDAFAALAAIALERVHYVDVAQEAVVSMEGERLRNSLLAALSHDLRTPLTGLVGLSESLTLSRPPLASAQMELACALRDEARRMSTLVANLLDMARIQSGGVKLKLEWQFVEEAVGAALRLCRWQLGARTVATTIPRELPLVRFDAALLERVLCNLLENAAKYTPPDARIELRAAIDGAMLLLSVCDDGPGLPAGREDALFEKFVRGRPESPIAGVGLGLAICRAIVDAHGGRMRAFNQPGGGACFELSLPLGQPPALPVLDHEEAQEK